MAVPVQLPTSVRDETYGGVTYRVEGELVPALQLELGEMPVRFEWHLLLWKDPAVQVELNLPSGGFKIMIGVVPLFFLAATDNVEYSFTRVQGASNILFGGTGFFYYTFSCPQPEGILWLHGSGNVFEATLAPGEQIDVEPGAWVYKDRTVQLQTVGQGLKTSFFGSGGQLAWERFTGPGRVGLQTMCPDLPVPNQSSSGSSSAR